MTTNPIKPDPTIEELEQQQKAIADQIRQRQELNRKLAMDAIYKMIQDNKLDAREVADMINANARRKKAPAMYRSPTNPRQTWSGQGQPPHWFVEAPDKSKLRIRKD